MPFVGVVSAQGSGMGGFGWWPLLWLPIILVVIGLLAVAVLDRRDATGAEQRGSDDALATLRTRYARGELSEEEFEERRAHLENQS